MSILCNKFEVPDLLLNMLNVLIIWGFIYFKSRMNIFILWSL
jgi:hypothetical protein